MQYNETELNCQFILLIQCHFVTFVTLWLTVRKLVTKLIIFTNIRTFYFWWKRVFIVKLKIRFENLTRTIKVSCLSRFLLRFYLCDKYLKMFNPDTLICTPAKFCIGTQKWLRQSLYRDTAPMSSNRISVPWLKSGLMTVCTATAHTQNQTCTRTAKTRAIPVLPPGLKSG